MKKNMMRAAWIVPNVLMYPFLIGFTAFTVLNAEGLQEINQLTFFVTMSLLLGLITIGNSFLIRSWIVEGKL